MQLKLTKLHLSQSILALSRQLLVHYHTLARPSSAGTAQNEGYKRAIYSPLGKKQAMTSPELWPKAQLISAVTAGATLGAVQLGAAGCSWVQLQLGAAFN